MSDVVRAAVEAAIETLQPGLDADGFRLRAGEVSAARVVVVLEATPEACWDCLVSDEMLVALLEAAVRDIAPGVGVELKKEGAVPPDGAPATGQAP